MYMSDSVYPCLFVYMYRYMYMYICIRICICMYVYMYISRYCSVHPNVTECVSLLYLRLCPYDIGESKPKFLKQISTIYPRMLSRWLRKCLFFFSPFIFKQL